MSLSVLVVPEDPTYNGYILKPLVQSILSECGRPTARVEVLSNPKAKGYEHAKKLLVEQVLDRYAHYDLILFLPDADGKSRSDEFNRLEAIAREKEANLFCCAAVQEVEVWLLAGHTEKLDEPWEAIRADVSVKDGVFRQVLSEHGDMRRAGGGRDLLMREALVKYSGIIQRCPELRTLQDRIAGYLSGSPQGRS